MLIENCKKIKIDNLIKKAKENLKHELLKAYISFEKEKIDLDYIRTRGNGKRLVFKCPMCDKKIKIIYINALNNKYGCRNCLNLKYRNSRYKGMIEEKKL
jgi:hypothetical protein